MNIAILDTGDICNPVGGQATYCRAIVPHLRGRVTYWGSVGTGETEVRCTGLVPQSAVVLTGALARPRAAGRKRLVPDRIICLLGVFRHRRKILAESDVIYVQSPELALPFVVGRGRVPVVLHMHGAGNPAAHARYALARTGLGRRLYGTILRVVLRKADAVLSVDSSGVELATTLRGKSSALVQLVPSCFDGGVYSRDPLISGGSVDASSRHYRIVFVGRLEEAKGVQDLIAALASRSWSLRNVTLAIVGDGSYRPVLERAVTVVPDTVTVDFLGWLGPEEVASQLRMADLMVLPSVQEGLPISVLEGLACGVPVVACDVGDISVVVRNGVNGYVIRRCTPETLATVMEDALGQDWDTDEIASSVAEYRCENVAKRVQALFETLMADPSRLPRNQ